MRGQATTLCTKRLVGVVAAALLTVMIPSMAFADPSSAELQVEAQATLASLNAMQTKLDEASANHFEAQQAQREAEAKSAEA